MRYDSDLQTAPWGATSTQPNAQLLDPGLPPLNPRYGGSTPGVNPATGTDATDRDIPMEAPLPPPAFGTRPVPPSGPPSGRSPRRSPGRGFVVVTALVAGLLGAALAFGAVWAFGGLDEGTQSRSGGVVRTPVVTDSPTVSGEGLDVVSVAEAVRPAIVNVKVAGTQGQGSGSGVIFDENGYILTNNHVVEGARRIVVQLTDGRELDAEVVGTYPDADIAVVKVAEKGLPTAPLGTAGDLSIGESVVAIGNPLGLEGGPTVTTGIVSALGRQVAVGEGEQLYDMIQTDAAILPGSSGGALVDASGNVIGITTAIAVSDAGAEGIGFATPIDVARNVAEQLIEGGEVKTALLGVEGTDFIDSKNGNKPAGALVTKVVPGGAADAAGIRDGDVVVKVDDASIDSMPDLKVAIRNYRPGDEVKIVVIRDGNEQTVSATLGEG